MNVAWVARDGYVNLFPLIEQRLSEYIETNTSYLCHTRDQAEHLRREHGITNITVIAHGVASFKRSTNQEEELSQFAEKYDAAPLIRALWSTMFELNLTEGELAEQALGHFKFWEHYLRDNDIDVLIYERPSILSSCIAWLVCQGLGIDSIDFVDTAVDTMTITNNLRGDYAEELQIRLDTQVDKASSSYDRAVAYIDRMRSQPTKTNEALLASELTDRRAIISWAKVRNLAGNVRREHAAKSEYFMYRNFLGSRLAGAAKYITRYNLHRVFNVFSKDVDPSNDKYFLFPLFMTGEWSNHVFMSLGYWDQVGTIKHIAQCLPVGSYLYVKEHHSMFAEHSFAFYRRIKKIRNVKLVSPSADTFELIQKSRGIVTLGSTMGFEALLMQKPVLLLGEPWYRVFPGLRKVDTPYQIADFMQRVDEIELLTQEETIKLAYALFDLSFDAVKWPRPGTLDDTNVESFARALAQYLRARASKAGTDT